MRRPARPVPIWLASQPRKRNIAAHFPKLEGGRQVALPSGEGVHKTGLPTCNGHAPVLAGVCVLFRVESIVSYRDTAALGGKYPIRDRYQSLTRRFTGGLLGQIVKLVTEQTKLRAGFAPRAKIRMCYGPKQRLTIGA